MGKENSLKGRTICVRLLPEEAEILQAKADDAHMSKAQFFRNVIVHGGAYEKTNFTLKDREKLMYEFNRIGNNLNQISIRVSGSEAIDKIKFLRLRENYLELLSEFYHFINDHDGK